MNEGVMHVVAGRSRSVLLWATLCFAAQGVATSPAHAVNYDIVYVRWPRAGNSTVVMLPQGEDPFRVAAGADLVLLHPDGSQQMLVDCDKCCVQDPVISFDGEWVYYTKMLDATNRRSPSFLFKMHIAGSGADFREIQLTFDDGYTGYLHQGNDGVLDDLDQWFGIRDMGPVLLPGSKIAFTSNRHAEIAFRQGSPFTVSDAWLFSVMQIYVMDDHDGELTNADLSNLRQVGRGNLHMVLHPVILEDGRLLFSNWDDAGGKFLYAMTTLYAMNPDGSNLTVITEPHDHHKNVDHFVTQLGGGTIVTAQYYPSYNFGFGHLCRFPIDPGEPSHTLSPSLARNSYNGYPISFRDFDRKGWESVTPHTSPDDCIAPNRSGKYCMPAAAPDGDMLVAYSTGGVNHNSTCTQGNDEVLTSGIYLILDAATLQVTNPLDTKQLVKIHSNAAYNAIWPKPVVAYEDIHGIPQPKAIPWTDSMKPADDRLKPAEPFALVGTSSLYNRESVTLNGDPFSPSTGRELHAGTWMLQGTDTGVVKNSDIHGVRIIAVVPRPFRQPIDKFTSSSEYSAVKHLIHDGRIDRFVEGYSSVHGERWKILGEFPVRKTDSSGTVVLDPKGDPDTSFVAKIPANTPFFYQGIDKNGMTLFSEMTWRAPVPGEVRTDCGGCHPHSIPQLSYSGTAAGRRLAIKAKGLDASDPMISTGAWDLTSRTPLIASDSAGTPTVAVAPELTVDIEYYRDVKPILERRCVSCHSTSANKSKTDLAFDGTTTTDDAYFRLVQDVYGKFGGTPPNGSYYSYPQLSKYVRANQARQSMLVWKLFGQRLDGRSNADRTDDLDFTPHSVSHGATIDEQRTIARWIDLGCPIDFKNAIHAGYRYTDDNGLPIINIGAPGVGWNATFDGVLRIGIADAESGADWQSLEVDLDTDLSNGVNEQPVSLASLSHASGSAVAALSLPGPMPKDREMLLTVTVSDFAGNLNRVARRFWISANADPPGSSLIVDNGSPGTASTGTWAVSTGANPYGANSVYASVAGATYSWSIDLPAPGTYAVHAWWTSTSARATQAQYTVVHAAGSSTAVADQTKNGGQWNFLGNYTFGATATVRLASSPSPASTSADAIRFVPLPASNAAPSAQIVSISPNPAVVGTAVSFSGSGTDSDGTVAAYEWRSSIAGIISTAKAFSTSSLAVGSHTISFRVKDDKGVWSASAERTLQVTSAVPPPPPPPPPPAQRIVVDNGAAGTSFTGTWGASGGTNPYGSVSVYARNSGTYSFKAALPAAGKYEVYAWWTEWPSRSATVPIDILFSGGTTRVTVNQKTNGGKWNLLGTFSFGTTATVTITAVGADTTCADAVSFLPTGAVPPPPPPPPPPVGSDIIVDNGAAGTSSTGTWSASSAPGPYGSSSLYAKNGPTYTYTISATGTYKVHAWWTEWSSRATAAPITIQHSGGTATVNVNQKTNGGKWNLLGTYTFSGKAVITIKAVGTDSTCADAVRLEKTP